MNPVFQQNVSISSAQRFSPPSVTESPGLNGRKTFYMAGEDLSFEAPTTKAAQSVINEVASIQSYDFQESISFNTPSATNKPTAPDIDPQVSRLQTRVADLKDELTSRPHAIRKHKQKLATEIAQIEIQLKTIESKQNLSQGAAHAIDSIEYYSRVSENDYMQDDNKPMLHAENGMQLMYIGLISMGQDEAKSEAAKDIFNKLAANPQVELSQSELQILEEIGLRKNEAGQLFNYGSGELFKASDAKDALGILAYQKDLGSINANFAANAKSKFAIESVRDLTAMVGNSRIHLKNEIDQLEQEQTVLKAKTSELTQQKEKASLVIQGIETQMTALNGTVASAETWLQKIGSITEAGQLSELIQSDPGLKGFLNKAGIDIRESQGQISLFKNGQSITENNALQTLSTKGHDLLDQLKSERSALEQDLSTAKHALVDTQTALNEVEQQVETVKQQQQKVIEAQDEYSSGLDELRAIKNDPERWAALSSEEQQAILTELDLSEPLLKRSQTVQQSVAQDLTQAASLISETRDFIQQAQSVLEQAEHILTVAGVLESQMNVALASFDQFIQLLESGQEQQTEVNQLIDRANELSSKLVLTPGVKTHDISELIQEWQDILKETAQIFTRWDKSSSSDQQIERKRMQAYAEKLLDDVAYQMNFMENLSEHREENQRDYLQRVIPQLSSSLTSAA